MSATQEQLQALRTNLDRLLRSYQAVKGENEILKQQVDAQRRGLADKNRKIEELEKQFEIVKTAQSIAISSNGNELPEDKAEVNCSNRAMSCKIAGSSVRIDGRIMYKPMFDRFVAGVTIIKLSNPISSRL